MSEGTPAGTLSYALIVGRDGLRHLLRAVEGAENPHLANNPKEWNVQAQTRRPHMIADVKCYFCGHISGQVEGFRGAAVTDTTFKPRPGYTGRQFAPGQRIRCERCGGPVFLEDVTPMVIEAGSVLARRREPVPGATTRKRAA